MEALSSLDISRTRESLHQIFVRCQKDSSVLSQKLIHQILQLGFRFNQSQNTEFRNTPSQPQAIDFSHMSVEEIEKLLEDEELRKRIARFVTMSGEEFFDEVYTHLSPEELEEYLEENPSERKYLKRYEP